GIQIIGAMGSVEFAPSGGLGTGMGFTFFGPNGEVGDAGVSAYGYPILCFDVNCVPGTPVGFAVSATGLDLGCESGQLNGVSGMSFSGGFLLPDLAVGESANVTGTGSVSATIYTCKAAELGPPELLWYGGA